MFSQLKLYIVIILSVVTPVLWAKSSNQAYDKQKILEYLKHGLKSKYGDWRGTNEIFPSVGDNTTRSTESSKVRVDVEGVTSSPNSLFELNNVSLSIHLNFTRETSNVQNDTSKMLALDSDWRKKGHLPKVVFKSGVLQNEILSIPRPKDYHWDQKEAGDQHKVDSPSPCRHGGTFVVGEGKYACHCPPGYSGVSCEIHTAICSRPLKPGRSLPCARRSKTCRPVAGGGFVCRSDVISRRSASYRGTSNMADCVGRGLCPTGWTCLNVNRTTDDYRCDPPHANPYADRGFRTGRARRSTTDFCNEELCQHGGKCKSNKCICLINYTGKYCEKEVNYCASNPCKEGVACEPRLGGYNCDCPATHMGIRCDIPKRITLKQMKRPRFLYFTNQYTAMTFTYCFYATSIGDMASVTVDFGDGVSKCAYGRNFTHAEDVQNQKLKALFPALNFLDVNPQLVAFKHSYKKTGYYNVTVEATNAKHIVYTSVHNVQVDSHASCKVTTKLRNCAKSVGANITEYNKGDHIVILSDATVNCSHAKLGFAWSLHQLKTKFDKHTPINRFQFGPEIATNEPHLNIYPYTLPFGIYAAQVNVTLKRPKSSVVESALTWFRVRELKIVSRLVEGSMQQVRWSDSAVLNASTSYNPNMPPGKQKNLMFAWTCAVMGAVHQDFRDEVDTFCPFSADIPLAATGPVLMVPPRSLLKNWEYVFAVHVKEASESPELHNLTESMMSVVVEVVTEHTPILTIKCVRNCENDEVNPLDTAVLEAVCVNCLTNMSEEVGQLQWTVTSVGGRVTSNKAPDDEIVLKYHESGSTSSTLLLDERSMTGHDRLLVSVHVKDSEGDDKMQNAVDGQGKRPGAERMINIAMPPDPGYCNIVPQLGYAMLTSFHIFCYNFKDNRPPLEYEAMQFTNYTQTDSNLLGTLVGYEVESEIHDIRLAAGLPEYDHLTLIRTFVSSKYLYTFYDFNVTVFPVLYYLKSPVQVLNFLTHMVEDERSSLVRMRDARNLFSHTQMIKVTAECAFDLLMSDYVRYIDAVELANIMNMIKDRLANVLNQEELLSLEGLKHYATALDAILRLPRYHTFSPANNIGGKLFGKVVDMLAHLKSKNVHFNKQDVEDLAPRLMSAASNMLRMPQDVRNSKTMMRRFGIAKGRTDDNNADFPNNEDQERFSNFTQTILKGIFSYGQHVIPHKANHEKSTLCESLTPDLILSVQKNAPKSFVKDGLYIEGLVGMMPMFSGQLNTFDNGLALFLLYIEQNPFWWHPNAIEINYPLVELRMYDSNSSPVKVPTKVMMQNPVRHQQETIHGQLAIHPYWTLNDFDIQVTRIQVPKSGKLIVQFMPIKGDHKIQVVVKKGFRPELIDFWKEAYVIPQKLFRNETLLSESYSIYVDEESTSDDEFYYVGVLPHIDTLHALIGEQHQKPSFPSMFSSKEDLYDDDEESDEKENEAIFFKPKAMEVRERTNNTLPFEYAAYSIRCLSLNTSSPGLDTGSYCQVRPATTFDTVFCKCDDFEMVTASFQNVRADLNMARSVQFYFPFIENPLTFYLIFFVLILFFLLLLWALWLDREEKPYRDIIFLADNDPRHSYFYLVIVQTGRRARAGTTSNVAIQLIGDVARSQVHVLRSAHRPVLTRGSQEWFVLKTETSLGNIGWINLWHDHMEASPYWYCSKVVVHDIQTNEVFFFFTEQWFTPLYMDGTMSCSVYNTADETVFEKRYRFGESFVQAVGDGYHVWLSPFYKTPGGSYTRCQRVAVAFAHVLVMLLIIIHLFEWPSQDDDLSENVRLWTNKNLYNGLCTALMAFPFHLCLALAFMCVTPKPPWWYTPVYWRQYMTIDKPNKFPTKEEKEAFKKKNAQGNRYYTVAYTVGMTKSSDPPEEARSVPPMIGKKSEQESFCLPHWFKYILWIVVSLFISIAVFFIYFNGVEHSTGTGYCTLVTLAIALLFSILVLEMLKLIIYAIYHSIISRKEIRVEDRSDLALFLEDEYKVERPMIPYRLDELELLRKEDRYRPIPQVRVAVLQRNAIKEASVRSMFTDIGIVLLFIFLLLIAINGVTDTLGYLNVRNVKNLIQGREGYGRTTLDMVTEREGFLNYINGSLIPNLYEEENNGTLVADKGWTSDLTNYLVGVPRLRQIRLQKEDCKAVLKPDRDWADRCRGSYLWLNEDTHDYAPQWKEPEKRKPGYHRVVRPQRGAPGDPVAWVHQTWWASATSWASGVVTAYSGGGYVALLGRTRQASWQSLDDLRANGWFDRLTVAVFLEFTLYNPNRNLVSAVRILAENTAMGGYVVHSSVQLVKLKQTNDIMPFIVFALFSLLVIALIICIHRDGFRIKKLRRWTYFGNIWYALNIVLAILGLIVAFCLLERTLLLSSSIEKLREPNVNKYVQFNVLQYWDQFLLGVMAFMLFLVILQTWHLLSVEYKCHLVMTVLQVATHSLICFAFVFAILAAAFMMLGHLLFVTTASQFRTLLSSFVAMVGFAHRDFSYDSVTHSSHNSLYTEMSWAKWFFLSFFFAYFFVFRWGFALILIEKFRRVSLVALRQRWLEPVMPSFMQMNLASVRHFGRRGFSRSQADSLVDEYVRASFRDSLGRLRAMERIVEDMRRERKSGPAYSGEFIARARGIAMTAMVLDHIEGQMQYKRRRPQAPEEGVAPTIRNAFAKEKKATAILVTYLKMNELEQKLDRLNDAVDQIMEYEEL